MDGIAWASSAMVAARTRLDIATGNLANVSTDGFRRVLARGVLTDRGAAIERVASSEHGALRRTGRPFDLAIVGDGAFRIRGMGGRITATRNGAFTRERDGTLRDDGGGILLGLRGPVHVPEGATIDDRGGVFLGSHRIDVLVSGRDASVRCGFLETANVNAIDEMVGILTAQRSFETAEKVVAAIDATRQKASNDVARIQ